MPGKLPYMQFYADDWLSDERLTACSLAAQGMWMRILCLMWKNERQGYLELNGQPPTEAQICRMAGQPESASVLLHELRAAGVPSVDERGVYYSRRMAHEAQIRHERSIAGSKGGKVSGMKRSKKQAKVEKEGQQTPKQRSDSDSGSNSGSNSLLSDRDEGVGEGVPPTLATPRFLSAWEEWQRHRKEKKAKLTPTAISRQLKKLAGWGADRAAAAIEHSIAQGWTGIFEPTEGVNGNAAARTGGVGAHPSRVHAPAGKYDNIPSFGQPPAADQAAQPEAPPPGPPARGDDSPGDVGGGGRDLFG